MPLGAGTATHGPATGMQTIRPWHSRAASASPGRRACGGQHQHEQQEPPHGALRNHSAESAAPTSSSTPARPAKPAVTSVLAWRWPSFDASRW